MKTLRISLFIIISITAIYCLGPRLTYESTDNQPLELNISIDQVETYIHKKEELLPIRKGNESIINWVGDKEKKTDYVLLYLHGFTASPQEGNPLHHTVASRYGMNLYAPRLADHGLDVEFPLKDLTPKKLVQSAKEAIAIAKTFGDSLIIMSCSTGSTLASILDPNEPTIAAHIMYAPNIDLYDKTSELITLPWGKELMKVFIGGETRSLNYTTSQAAYWYQTYHTNGIIALKTLIEEWIHEELFDNIDTPIYVGYYYKDDENQDKVISVNRIHDFLNQVSTPTPLIKSDAFSEANTHVICSSLFSQSVEEVRDSTFSYIENILHIKPQDINVSATGEDK